MSTTYKQILRAKMDFETSLAGARDLRDQWLSAMDLATKAKESGQKQVSKKELDQGTKALKNKLLAVKWDFEDLEELLGVYKYDGNRQTNLFDVDEIHIVEDLRRQIGDWRNEIAQMVTQMEDAESNNRLYNKHGITFHNPISAALNNNTSNQQIMGNNKYERLSSEHPQQQHDNEDVVQFDKSLVSPGGASIVNNMLYDHLEEDRHRMGGNNSSTRDSFSDPSQVFNNLSRPVTTNVYMNPNENEMILNMLETEYYNPPDGLLGQEANNNKSTRLETMFRKIFDTNRNKFLGTIVFLCSFPTLLILFMIA